MATVRTWPLVAGSSTFSLLASNTSRYLPVAGKLNSSPTSTISQIVIRGSYTATRMFVNLVDNRADNSSTIFFDVNGTDSVLQVSIAPDTSGTFEDTVNSVPLADGDLINYRSTIGSGGTAKIQAAVVGLKQEGDVGVNLLVTRGVVNNSTGTWYFPIAGSMAPLTLEASSTLEFQSSATLSNMRLYVSGNTHTSGTVNWQLRRAGADGRNLRVVSSVQLVVVMAH